ncbi:hypothetical protein [Micromonospora endophytica]|uniref:Uncharacterized protein n=1 Tax=Micromonospora endophytica TaxID=515350 RepID=A0A2W2DLD2_9ACTN|nr:hypothetical protein [Micromonospora endophytica]PZG00538.1 hypothetical protein C1I93_02135 [Micromonospora endophytica]RIW45805.1 hypothetical protein D3H59_13910 [Micromonospora endophytica]BCJ61947.1 hypothetical protein Jiend_53690 [Micromonospora endophytica]
MGWLQRVLGGRQVEHDPGRQEALLQEVRHRFGIRVQLRARDQIEAITQLLDNEDGLVVATWVVREVADQAHTDLLSQAADLHRRTGYRLMVDRRNYRPLWREAGSELRWPLFDPPGGLHPYVQVVAAATVIGNRASRVVKATDPEPVLSSVFELFDLTSAGWEYGRVRPDTDGAELAMRLIAAAREINAALPDPPPLPQSVRELMRRNNTVHVYDPAGDRVVGGINLGAELRPALLS